MCAGRIDAGFRSIAVGNAPARRQITRIVDEPVAELAGAPVPSIKAKRLLAALFGLGWKVKRQSGSHRTLPREGWPDVVFAAKKSAPECLRASPSTPASLQKICSVSGVFVDAELRRSAPCCRA